MRVKAGDFNHLFFAVRPATLIIVYLLPLTPDATLSLISIISYIISIILTFFFTKCLYDNTAATFAAAFLASNFPVILNSSSPNADLPGLAACLLLQCIGLRFSTYNKKQIVLKWVLFGLLSGIFALIREPVIMSIIAICLLLIHKRLFREFLLYSIVTFSIITLWQIYAYYIIHMSYITQLLTGLSLSTKYSGVAYNPLKILGYLLNGLSPILIISGIIGILLDDNKERFKILHIFGIPPLVLSIAWPAIYEPRLAIIALPGLIHISGYGLKKIMERLSELPFYGALKGLFSLLLILLIYFLGNFFLAYINNGYKISPIWRYI
ncbi:MAG: glycosyltransferase family 39 protein [Nitrososphaerota archaeon]